MILTINQWWFCIKREDVGNVMLKAISFLKLKTESNCTGLASHNEEEFTEMWET